uniref:Putative L-lactate dehydrogenase B n=1 Tax=Aegilops tauschii TaxID=37682 RepID=M8B1J7_AEGTA
MGVRWIPVLAGGKAPISGASSSFVRVCVLLKKTRWWRLLDEDEIRFSPPTSRPNGVSTIVGGRLERNVALYRKIVPPVAEHSPDALLLVVSNPVDVLTYVTWKLSGFPASRVIGSGTNLDSSRFRFLVAEHLDVSAQDVQLGGDLVEHQRGRHAGAQVAARQPPGFDEAALEGIRRAVVGGAYEVIGLKGYTSWAIGYSVASLAASLLRDQRRVHPVSVLAAGFHGISDGHEVFLSLPARLGRAGVLGVAEMDLTEAEAAQLRRSAKTLWENCQLLGL